MTEATTGDAFLGLFDQRVTVVQGRLDVAEYALLPEEAAAVAQAGEKRRREFAVGRTLARQALARLGVPEGAIPAGPDRAPRWPTGIVGSISHAKEVCVVAVGKRHPIAAIGIDVEAAEPMSPKLFSSICTRREREWIERQPEQERGGLAILLFTAKEAVYKCQFPLTARFLGFEDVDIDFDLSGGTFLAVESPTGKPLWPRDLRGDARFVRTASHVASAVTLYESESNPSDRESRLR